MCPSVLGLHRGSKAVRRTVTSAAEAEIRTDGERMQWDGMGLDGMGWDGTGRDGTGWDGMG